LNQSVELTGGGFDAVVVCYLDVALNVLWTLDEKRITLVGFITREAFSMRWARFPL